MPAKIVDDDGGWYELLLYNLIIHKAGQPRGGNHASQASWENASATTPAGERTNDGRYGTI